MNEKLQHFLKFYALDHKTLIFPFGSQVYGTCTAKSDWDYLAVIPDNAATVTGTEYNHNGINVHIYKKKDWQDQLNLHKIHRICGTEAPILSYAQGYLPSERAKRVRRQVAL